MRTRCHAGHRRVRSQPSNMAAEDGQGHARRLLVYVAEDHFMTGGKTLGGTEMQYMALGPILMPLQDKFRITVTPSD